MVDIKLRPIILAGGSGKRLWPLSTKEKPKQFIPLFGEYSLFDLTLQRLNKENLFKKPYIVTSEDYIKFVEASLERTGIEPEMIILEPLSKNTFPAISLAVLMSLKKSKDETFYVAPSDHYLSKNKEFHESCKIANKNLNEGLILFGVEPEHPSPEYGYIMSNSSTKGLNEVSKFVEKPCLEDAEELINVSDAFWNAGMFFFKSSWFKQQCTKIDKDFLHLVEDLLPEEFPSDLYYFLDRRKFNRLPNLSFDKAFVEKSKKNYMIILDAGWSDLGSWFSLSTLRNDLGIKMNIFSDHEYIKVEKPWGYFENLMETDTSKVKLLSIFPNQKLSLQKHKFRSETWHVIQGEAKVTKGNERFTMQSGDSVIIRKNEIHRLENISDKILEIIEIQTGSYFGEDDIVRLKDSYGRVDLH